MFYFFFNPDVDLLNNEFQQYEVLEAMSGLLLRKDNMSKKKFLKGNFLKQVYIID